MAMTCPVMGSNGTVPRTSPETSLTSTAMKRLQVERRNMCHLASVHLESDARVYAQQKHQHRELESGSTQDNRPASGDTQFYTQVKKLKIQEANLCVLISF